MTLFTLLVLVINNILIYLIMDHIISWRILRIVEEMIKETGKLLDNREYEASIILRAIGSSLNNSVGSRHDRQRTGNVSRRD